MLGYGGATRGRRRVLVEQVVGRGVKGGGGGVEEGISEEGGVVVGVEGD